jgi:pimeloyl-ACP methyl ester carboxylesterase
MRSDLSDPKQPGDGCTALFLHGGPGLSAGIERLWFGDSLPASWWDQPLLSADDSSPFEALVSAATKQLEQMTAAAARPVDLLAHSFGGQIAIALARRSPNLVRSIRLLASPADPIRGLFRLCKAIARAHYSADLERAIDAAEQDLNPHSFEAMILAAASHPAYPAIYFAPRAVAARDRFLALLPRVRFLDPTTFFAVINTFLTASPIGPVEGFSGEVTLLLGREDPLVSVEGDLAQWRRILPKLQAEVVDAGHFVHLELAPTTWWPGWETAADSGDMKTVSAERIRWTRPAS